MNVVKTENFKLKKLAAATLGTIFKNIFSLLSHLSMVVRMCMYNI